MAVGLGIIFSIYHTLLLKRVAYVESPPNTFGAYVLILLPSTLILIAIYNVQYLVWGSLDNVRSSSDNRKCVEIFAKRNGVCAATGWGVCCYFGYLF